MIGVSILHKENITVHYRRSGAMTHSLNIYQRNRSFVNPRMGLAVVIV